MVGFTGPLSGPPAANLIHVERRQECNRLATGVRGKRMISGRNPDGSMDMRETGLKPLDGCRLKGVLIYSPLHSFL